jgi:hypothetical protein
MEINYNQQISHKGLNRQLCKRIATKENIERLNDLYPKSHSIVGNLPPQWINNIPTDERSQKIPQLYSQMGKFISNWFFLGNKVSSVILTHILRANGAIEKDANIAISKVGEGCFAKGYKLLNTKDGSELFLKRFSSIKKRDLDLIQYRHGAEYELNSKSYIKHKLKKNSEKSHFSRFYFGDMRNKYYVEEYLTDEQSLDPKSIAPSQITTARAQLRKAFYMHNLAHCDMHNHNMKFYQDKNDEVTAKLFDLGGMHKII